MCRLRRILSSSSITAMSCPSPFMERNAKLQTFADLSILNYTNSWDCHYHYRTQGVTTCQDSTCTCIQNQGSVPWRLPEKTIRVQKLVVRDLWRMIKSQKKVK